MSLYPDNVPRANRVRQLAADIAHLQEQLKEDVEDMRKRDVETLNMLNDIATKAGFKTLDEYVAAGAKLLPQADRDAFNKMKDDVEKLDEDMELSHKVFRGLIAVGLLTHGIRIFVIGFKETQSLLFGAMAVLKSIAYAILGAVETAVRLATWGRVTLNLVSRTGVAAEAAESMKLMRIGGDIMVGVGVLVDAVLLIVEAVQGDDQRGKLRRAITELAARRFLVKQMQQQARVILNFKSDAKAVVKMKQKYDQWIAAGKETPESAAADLEPDMQAIATDMKAAMDQVTAQNVWNMLAEMDKASQIAWTNEDPDLDGIKRWIVDHPEADS